MSTYSDTGAVIRLYYPEAESRILSEWVVGEKQRILFSLFHKTEMNNAFALKLFRREISGEQYNQVRLHVTDQRKK